MKSFMNYSVLTLLNFFLLQTNGQINDTPGGNLTLQFREREGRCPDLPNAAFSPRNRKLFEGRWFAIQVGFQPSQARNINCLVWDSFFDQKGLLHNFLYGFENGEFKTGNTRLTPVKGRNNVYTIETGAPGNDKFISTLYFVDGDIFIFGEVVCRENGNHFQNAVIGVRNLRIAFARSAQISSIMNDLEYETEFDPDKTEITHSRSCTYPPPRRNPYTRRPAGGGGYGGYGGYGN